MWQGFVWQGFPILKERETPESSASPAGGASAPIPAAHRAAASALASEPPPVPEPRRVCLGPAPAARREEAEGLRGARRGKGAVSHRAAATPDWAPAARMFPGCASTASAPRGRWRAARTNVGRRAPRGRGRAVFTRCLDTRAWRQAVGRVRPAHPVCGALARLPDRRRQPSRMRRVGRATVPRATLAKVARAWNPGSRRSGGWLRATPGRTGRGWGGGGVPSCPWSGRIQL